MTAVVPEGVGAGQIFQLAVAAQAAQAMSTVHTVAITSPQTSAPPRSFSFRGLQMQGSDPRELPVVAATAVETNAATAANDQVEIHVHEGENESLIK